MSTMDRQASAGPSGGNAFLPAQQPHDQVPLAETEFGNEQFWHQVVDVEEDRDSGATQWPGGEDNEVGHCVRLNQIKRLLTVLPAQGSHRGDDKATVSEDVPDRIAAAVAVMGYAVDLYAIDGMMRRASLHEAEDVYRVTGANE
jgi:hypothetical protein